MNLYLIISLVVNVILLILLIIFISRAITVRDNHYNDYNKWSNILHKLYKIDQKHYFQEDEEVGIIFKNIKTLLYESNNKGNTKSDTKNKANPKKAKEEI